MLSGTRNPVGRPIEAAPVINAVGLMRHLIGAETGANLRVAAEIERMAGRPVLTGQPGTAARRVSEFVLGRKSVPGWVDHAARRWCVHQLADASRRHELGVVNMPGRVSASEGRLLVAEGLVSSLLTAVMDQDEKRAAGLLKRINAITN